MDSEAVALVRAVAAGDESALGRAYDLYGGLVRSIAMRVLGNPSDAEEVLQDVFLRLWDRAGTFDPGRGRLAGFLVTVTRNRAIDVLRARGAGVGPMETAEPSRVPHDPVTPLEIATRSDAQEQVKSALATLPEPERRVLEMAYFDGLSQSRIAELTDTALGTVKGRARNGLRRLRAALAPSLGEVA